MGAGSHFPTLSHDGDHRHPSMHPPTLHMHTVVVFDPACINVLCRLPSHACEACAAGFVWEPVVLLRFSSGLASGMPLAAIATKPHLMDKSPPGSMGELSCAFLRSPVFSVLLLCIAPCGGTM